MMNLISLHRKYKIKLTCRELEAMLRVLTFALGTTSGDDISTRGQCYRMVQLGQRFQAKYFRLSSCGQKECTISLNISEAATLCDMLRRIPVGSIGAFENTVIYYIMNELR